MRRKRCLCLITLSLFWAPSLLHAQTERRLSLEEALRLARARSPVTRGAEARIRGAGARLRAAGAPLNPTLSLAQPWGRDTGGFDEGVLLTQTVEAPDKRRLRVREARAERDAALAESAGTTSDLDFAVRSAYYEALRADAERAQAADALSVAQTFAEAAETQFQAGDVARSNVVRSRIELARAEQTLAAAETERVNRAAALQSLIGLPENATLVLTNGLTADSRTYDLPTLQTLARQNRPDLRAARRLREARAAGVDGARAQRQPDLFVEARRATLDSSDRSGSIRAGVTLPLLDLGRNRADVEAARAALGEQAAAVDEAERSARLDVETAFRNREMARRAVASFESGRLEHAKELLEMARIGYERGAGSYLELLDAQQVYRTEQTEYARARAALLIATAALQRAVGDVLP